MRQDRIRRRLVGGLINIVLLINYYNPKQIKVQYKIILIIIENLHFVILNKKTYSATQRLYLM